MDVLFAADLKRLDRLSGQRCANSVPITVIEHRRDAVPIEHRIDPSGKREHELQEFSAERAVCDCAIHHGAQRLTQ